MNKNDVENIKDLYCKCMVRLPFYMDTEEECLLNGKTRLSNCLILLHRLDDFLKDFSQRNRIFKSYYNFDKYYLEKLLQYLHKLDKLDNVDEIFCDFAFAATPIFQLLTKLDKSVTAYTTNKTRQDKKKKEKNEQ